MSEAWGRLVAAWAVLRGWTVIRNVDISHGDISPRGNRVLVGRSDITDNRIHARGPVIMYGRGAGVNTGDGLLGVARNSRDARRMKRQYIARERPAQR